MSASERFQFSPRRVPGRIRICWQDQPSEPSYKFEQRMVFPDHKTHVITHQINVHIWKNPPEISMIRETIWKTSISMFVFVSLADIGTLIFTHRNQRRVRLKHPQGVKYCKHWKIGLNLQNRSKSLFSMVNIWPLDFWYTCNQSHGVSFDTHTHPCHVPIYPKKKRELPEAPGCPGNHFRSRYKNHLCPNLRGVSTRNRAW